MKTLVWTKTESFPSSDYDVYTVMLSDGSAYEFKLSDSYFAFSDGGETRVVRRSHGYLYKLIPFKYLEDEWVMNGTENEIFESIEKRISEINPEGYLATVLKN